jgi:hypothetical protein
MFKVSKKEKNARGGKNEKKRGEEGRECIATVHDLKLGDLSDPIIIPRPFRVHMQTLDPEFFFFILYFPFQKVGPISHVVGGIKSALIYSGVLRLSR